MFCHASKETRGFRAWWHLSSAKQSVIQIECCWWSRHCGLTIGTDDDGWNLSLRLPPFAFYLSLDGIGLWQPKAKHLFTWDNNREVWLPDRREFDVSISNWTMRLTPWGRWGEWRSADPWWIRGLSFDVQRFVLGRRVYEAEELALVPCHVPMPEGNYPAVAKVQRVTRGFERWFKRVGQEVTLDIPKGIPFAGKGENSWDCGDDGLFGIGGVSINDAISRAQESVAESRRRNGRASDEALRAALA